MTQMSKAVMEPLALGEVLNLIARSGQELLSAEVCSVFMVRRAGFLSLEAVCGAKDNSFRRGLELEITKAEGGGLTGYIAHRRKLFNRRGKELVNHPAVKNPGEQPHLPSKRCSSLTAVPLKRKLYDKGEEAEEVIGLIKAENKKNRAGTVDPERGFDYDDTVILAALATYAETAIRNAQLFDLANVSQKVVKVASSTLNLDEVLQHVLAELRTLIPFETASIQLLEEDELRVVACEGFGEKDREKVLQLRYPLEPKYPNSEVVKQRKPFIISDIATSTRYQHFTTEAESYCSGHIRSWFGVPLVSGDKVIGMLSIESDLPDNYTSSHVDLAVAFAGQVVSSIENAQMYRNASGQSLLKVVPILNIAGDLNPDILLKTIAEYAVDKKEGFIGADIAIIYLYNPETDCVDQKPVYAGSPLKYPERVQPPFTKASVVHRLIESREGRFRDNVYGDDLLDRMFVRRENVRSAAGLPLLVGNQPLGVMFINYLTPHSFTNTEKELINVFAQKAALDIQRARQYEAVNVQLQATSERLLATRNAAVYLSFMSAWAHDAAQHTYILRGDTESLLDYIPSPTPEVQAILERIKNVAEKIAELIPDAPSDLSDKRLLSVHEVIRNSVAAHEGELGAKRITVNNQFGVTQRVLANEWLLKSAFNHLVQNAIKAMPGGGTLSFAGRAMGANINIQVKDTGRGIPPEKHQYLFWQRISSTDKGGGSGVGLMLTRLYLNACDGDITLEHSNENGTTFNIHLPASPERP
jgi:GAF domain-containing protein